jgi:hypothetical protein
MWAGDWGGRGLRVGRGGGRGMAREEGEAGECGGGRQEVGIGAFRRVGWRERWVTGGIDIGGEE